MSYTPTGPYAAIPTAMEPYDDENADHVAYMNHHFADVPADDRPDRVINYDAVEELVDYLADAGMNGVVPAGCTGQSFTLRHSEHVEFVDRVAEMARDPDRDLDVLAGDGSNATWEARYLAGQIDDRVEPDAHMMISPYGNKPEQDGLIRHYGEIADRMDAPIILYTVPGRTGRDIDPETTAELAAHDSFAGIKEASGDLPKIAETAELVAEYGIDDFAVGSGNDAQNYGIFTQATARDLPTFTISVAGNVDPEAVVAEYEAAATGDYDRARAVNHERRDLDNAIFDEQNPIPVHEALEWRGFDYGTPREPLDQRPSPETQELLEDALQTEELLEIPET